MRRTLTTGLLFGVLAVSGVARAQSTGEEHRAAGMAAYRNLHTYQVLRSDHLVLLESTVRKMRETEVQS